MAEMIKGAVLTLVALVAIIDVVLVIACSRMERRK